MSSTAIAPLASQPTPCRAAPSSRSPSSAPFCPRSSSPSGSSSSPRRTSWMSTPRACCRGMFAHSPPRRGSAAAAATQVSIAPQPALRRTHLRRGPRGHPCHHGQPRAELQPHAVLAGLRRVRPERRRLHRALQVRGRAPPCLGTLTPCCAPAAPQDARELRVLLGRIHQRRRLPRHPACVGPRGACRTGVCKLARTLAHPPAHACQASRASPWAPSCAASSAASSCACSASTRTFASTTGARPALSSSQFPGCGVPPPRPPCAAC